MYALASAVQTVAAIVVIPAMTRKLGSEQYGVVATALALYQIVQVFVTAGLPVAAAWSVYEATKSSLESARRLVAATVVVAGMAALAIHLLGPMWSPRLLELPYDRVLAVAILCVVPGAGLAGVLAILQAGSRPRAFATCALSSAVGGQLIGVALVFSAGLGAVGYLAGMVVGNVVGAAIGLRLTRVSLLRLPGIPAVWSSVQQAGPTVLHSAAFIVLASADRLLVERFLGLEDAGRYHASYLVGSVGMIAALALNNAWAPMIYRAAEDERWLLLRDTTATVYGAAAIVAGGLAIGAPIALAIFVPGSYRPSDLTPVTAIVAGCLLPYVTYLSGVHVLFQRRRVTPLAVATALAGAANVALNLLLIPLAGLVGSALATLLGYLLWAWLVRRAASRVVDVPWRSESGVLTYVIGGALVLAGAVAPAVGSWLFIRAAVGAGLLVLLLSRFRG